MRKSLKKYVLTTEVRKPFKKYVCSEVELSLCVFVYEIYVCVFVSGVCLSVCVCMCVLVCLCVFVMCVSGGGAVCMGWVMVCVLSVGFEVG